MGSAIWAFTSKNMIGVFVIFILLVGYMGYLWKEGGMAREVSKYGVIGLFAFIMANWVAVWIYKCWEVYQLYQRLGLATRY